MKFPLLLLGLVVVVAAYKLHVSANIITGIATILDIVDLALSISNVVSGGCSYYPSICTMTDSINVMERELKPKLAELDRLDLQNSILYANMTNVLANNNDLSQQSGNLQFLVIAITKRLGDARTYERLAQEFDLGSTRLLLTFREELDAIRQQSVTKTIVLGSFTGAKLLYSGLKLVYKQLKKRGYISPPTFRRQAVRARPISLALQPITNPRWYRAKQSVARFKTWWNKPKIAKIRRYMKSAGVLVGSMFSLGVSVTVDVTMARRMRDSLRNTEQELLDIKTHIDGNLTEQRQINNNFMQSFYTARKEFSDLSKILGDAIQTKTGITPARIMATRTPNLMIPLQRRVIDAYAEFTEQLQAVNLNAEILEIIQIGVEFEDSLRRIKFTLRRHGYADVTEEQILRAIAKEFPDMVSYDGHSLTRYRG